MSVQLELIELGDKPSAWAASGFTVLLDDGSADSGSIFLPNLHIRLTGQGSGLCKLNFCVMDCKAYSRFTLDQNLSIEPILHHTAQQHPKAIHPNTASSVGEIVLYTSGLKDLVAQLAQLGIQTTGNKPPRQQGPLSVARYMLGSDECSIRMLVVGPSVDAATLSPKQTGPMAWMLGTCASSASIELTGWLIVTKELLQVKELVPSVGAIRDAVQSGRQICTLKRGTIHSLTGTFAFLSDNGLPLFAKSHL